MKRYKFSVINSSQKWDCELIETEHDDCNRMFVLKVYHAVTGVPHIIQGFSGWKIEGDGDTHWVYTQWFSGREETYGIPGIPENPSHSCEFVAIIEALDILRTKEREYED